MKKAFPELRNLHTREGGDLVLEGDKEPGHYRWLALEARRLCSGHVNPETLADAYKQHETGPGGRPASAQPQRPRLRGAGRDVRLRLQL